jgi:hypothetical protein
MNSGIRPKCEPTITVEGQTENGEEVFFLWRSRDIQDFTFKSTIDPIGRNLPTLELTWTEIYTGKLTEQNMAEKYDKVMPCMRVKLSFEQNLNWFNSWRDIYSKKWSDLLNTTWQEVYKGRQKETVVLQDLFLVARPEINGQTITWKARDLLYFLNDTQEIGFKSGIPYTRPNSLFLLNERGNFRKSPNIISSLEKTAEFFEQRIVEGNTETSMIYSGKTKDILKNNELLRDKYLMFKNNIIISSYSQDLFSKPAVFDVPSKVLKKYPQIIKNNNISSYSFTQHLNVLDHNEAYTMTPSTTISSMGVTLNRFIFKDWGVASAVEGDLGGFVIDTISKYTDTNAETINVVPVKTMSIEKYVSLNNDGEVFSENNPLNVYDEYFMALRHTKILNSYFNRNVYTLEFESLPFFHLQTGDVINVPTNLFSNNQNIQKKGVIVGQEINYNGGFSAKTTLHEIGEFL